MIDLVSKDRSRLRSAMRRVWLWSQNRKECVSRARIQRGIYQCEGCRQLTHKIQADHIIECGAIDDGFISRLFCSADGLQALCEECHSRKTKKGREMKKVTKKKKLKKTVAVKK